MAERRTIAGTRTKIQNRVNKCNGDMITALGSKPAAGELGEIRLTKLMQEDEWGEPTVPPRHNLRTSAELRPVDLPSARSDSWRSVSPNDLAVDVELKRRAMRIEERLLTARANEELGHVRTTLVDQANTFLTQIRSGGGNEARGYHLTNASYAEVQKQGKAVRMHAQIYNMCVRKLRKLNWDTTAEGRLRTAGLHLRYRYLESNDLVCSTATYSSRGTSPKFTLPWFWRMVSFTGEESEEDASKADEKFVAECDYCLYLSIWKDSSIYSQSFACAG